MIVYIAGPYRADTKEDISANIERARDAASSLWAAGHTVICPHMNTAHMDGVVDDSTFLRGDIDILARCDAIYLLKDFAESIGSVGEYNYAQSQDIPIYFEENGPESIPLHPTELRCPNQVRRFMEIIMKQYRVHLDKNADYSPANIAGTGFIGVIVRMWDKMARLMNLSGFDIVIHSSELRAPKDNTVKDEAIEDTILDMANYAIIARMNREGTWGV